MHYKQYFLTLLYTWITFSIATFCMVVFFIHAGDSWIITRILISLLYGFVIVACAKELANKLSLAALMLLIPIAPLAMLILVVSLIQVIQYL